MAGWSVFAASPEAQGLIDAGAARSIKTYHELAASLTTALDQHEYIGAKAAKYIQSELGTTEKIYNYIFSWKYKVESL